MAYDAALESIGRLHAEFGPQLDTMLLLFVRMLAFATRGPIFNRKNIPFLVKIAVALFFTMALFWMIPPEQHGSLSKGETAPFILQIIMNVLVGSIIGFVADTILQAIYAAGSLMTNQIGLSSASLLDPSTGRQAMIMETLFSMLGIILFMHLGGVQWMVIALQRSLEVLPLYAIQQPLMDVINMEYLITISGNVLLVGVQLVAPIFVVTVSVDMMLGIVNRTAQQMPVFQLSFALKPAVGAAVLLMTLPIFMSAMEHFLNDFAHIF